MASSTTKKALVRRFERESLAGYVNHFSYLQLTGIELLLADGNVLSVPYPDIKTVSFVRDFDKYCRNPPEPSIPGPKWTDFGFVSNFAMATSWKGIMPNNLLQVEPYGFLAIPPESGARSADFHSPERRSARWKCWEWWAVR